MSERRRGAVRSESARLAILEATARLFAERGYDQLSMEGIAAAAGVGKQTIYRWWSSKGALVAECLLEGVLLPDRFIPGDTGELRADLVAWLDDLARFIGDPANETLLRSLLAAAAENEEVGRRLNESLGAGSALIVRLQSAVAAADLPPDAPIHEIVEALVGALILRILSRARLEPESPRRLVDAMLGAAHPGVQQEAQPTMLSETGRGARVLRDLVFAEPVGHRPLALDLHLPAADAPPVILFVHGGGWQSGSRREFGPEIDDAFGRLVAAGFAVASVDYRFSSEAIFPAQVDDVAAALEWLRANGERLGLDASRVVLWGESAGATLAALLGLRADAAVRGVIDWYGPTDFIEHARALGREHDPDCSEAKWIGSTVAGNPDAAAAASPARQVRLGAPPFLIVNGTKDASVPLSQAELLTDALLSAGAVAELVLVEGAGHRWEGAVDREALLDDAIEFARRVTA